MNDMISVKRNTLPVVSSVPSAGVKGKLVFVNSDDHAYLDNGTSQKKVLLDGDVTDNSIIWAIVFGG